MKRQSPPIRILYESFFKNARFTSVFLLAKKYWLGWYLELQDDISLKTIGFIYLMVGLFWFPCIQNSLLGYFSTTLHMWINQVRYCIPISLMGTCTKWLAQIRIEEWGIQLKNTVGRWRGPWCSNGLFWHVPKWCNIAWLIKEWAWPEGLSWQYSVQEWCRSLKDAGYI